jgi:peptidoglycan hydrolase-like protein with peptidoglycan-binding domain
MSPSTAELQSRLFDLGYYDGPVDGQASELTVAAFAKFQHDHGLPVTGLSDPTTLQTMRESYCY